MQELLNRLRSERESIGEDLRRLSQELVGLDFIPLSCAYPITGFDSVDGCASQLIYIPHLLTTINRIFIIDP